MVEILNNKEVLRTEAEEKGALLEESREMEKNLKDEVRTSARENLNERVDDKEPTVGEALYRINMLSNFSTAFDATFEEMMSIGGGSKETIKAIQVLLKEKGYDVGSIDGILKTATKKTSKTMEAIKKFQQDLGIKPVDGVPGLNTIRGLMISFGDVDFRCITSITDKEAEILSRNDDGYGYDLGGLVVITDKQAEYLSKVNGLWLNGLTSITDKQAEEFGKNRDLQLYLDGLTSITDKQAEHLSKVKELSLDGLKNITDKQAEEFGKSNEVYLDGLTSITDKQAEYLSKANVLVIRKEILTPKQKQILKKHI